uniref:Actin interacting protein 3-like C-terminal domain-containing protein n=1 Tax=Branchiostoma floridae TaxID=7739 RepID=C3ZP12_BRAFL|eukprot:XP_002589736.1 hypothetical protein BRAFLDRAFT_128390 [Branchiostoma floridae]
MTWYGLLPEYLCIQGKRIAGQHQAAAQRCSDIPATSAGHGRPIARPTDDIQVKLNGTLNGHGGRKRHFNRDEPRRHTLGGPRSQMEMKRENSEMEKLERQRQAFLEHLKKKYPQHAQAISGHQKQTRTLSSSHVAEVMEEEDRASVASEQSEPPMGTATAGFSRGSRLRSSLPVVRTPILSKEKSKGIVYLQVNDETKRSIMPNEVTGLDTVRAMFVRAFPHRLTMQIMEQPHVKIYIRDSKSDVYYELEEMKEVQDRACLKIHVPGLADTLPMYHTPSPNSTVLMLVCLFVCCSTEREVQDRACLKIHVPGLADTLPMYHTPSPNSTLSSTTVSNVSLVIEEDGTDSVRNGPSPRPDMARHSPRYQTAVHNTSHQTYQMIKQSNEQKIQQLSNHVSESGSSSEHSTPKQQSPQSTVQRQPHPYQSRGPPPPMSGPPKPAHAAPPPPASPRHTQGGAPPPQHQQQVSRQQTAYYVGQSQAAPQHSVQPPQHSGPYSQQSSPHPQQGSPHPQQGPPHPQQGSPHPQQGSPHHPQQSSPHPQQGAPHPQQVGPHPRTSPHSPHVAQQHANYVYSAQQVPQQRGPPPQGHPQRGTPPQGRPQGHPQGHPGMPAGVPKSASMPNYYQQRPAQGRHPGQKMHPSQHAPAMYQRQTSGPGSGGSRASPVMGVQPRGRRSLPHLAGSDVEDEVIQQLRTGHRRGYGSSQTSGTSSPIVNDDEASMYFPSIKPNRKRMANIEQQIASLAGLVQTALTHGEDGSPAAGAPPGTGKEEEKGRHPSVARSESSHSGFSAESVSTVSGRVSSPLPDEAESVSTVSGRASSPLPDERVAEKAKRIHHTTQGLREQLNQLRIIHRHNEQEMNETFEKVKREIQVRLSRSPSGSIHPVRTQRSRVDLEMHNYRKRAEIVEKKLSELERWVEEVRTDVVNKRCRVSVGDVDAMLKALGRSEKDWRELQDTWPGLNEELKAVLSAEMEVVVQEERFVKDETDKVEGALKRIKKLTGTLHTLQRLASVQEHRPAQVPVFEQKGEPDQEKLLEEIKGLTPDHEKRLQSIQASPQPAKPPEDTAKPAEKAKPEKAEPEPKESSVSETDSSPSKEEQMTLSPSSTSVSSETTSTGQSDLQESPQDQTKDSPAMKATPRPLPSPTKQHTRELPPKKKPAPQPSARSPPPKQPSIPPQKKAGTPPQKQPVTPPPKQAVTPPPKQVSTPPPKQIPRSVSPTKKAPSPTIPPKKENTIVAMEAKTAPPQPPVKKSPPASSPPPKKQQQSVPTPPPKPGAPPHSPPWQKEHRSVSPPMMRPISPPAKPDSPKTSPVKREPTSPPPSRDPAPATRPLAGQTARAREAPLRPASTSHHSTAAAGPDCLTRTRRQFWCCLFSPAKLPPPTTEATLQRHNRFRALQRLKTKFMQETSPPPSPQLSSPDSRNNNKESPKFDKELKKEIKKQKKLNKKAEKQRKEEEKEEKKRKKKPPKLEMPHKEQEYSPSLVSPWERRKPLSPTLEMEFEEMEKAEGRGSEGHDPEGHESESCSPESRDSEGRDSEGRDSEGRSPEGRDSEGHDPKGRGTEGHGSEGHSSPVTPPDTTRGTTTPTGDSGLSDSLLEEQLLTQHAAEEARERRLRLGSHGPETRKLVEALKEAEETLQQAVITTDSKDKIEVLIPQESPKVENGSQHSPSGQVLEPGKKVPPPPPPRKNWITSPASPPPRSPAHSPPIISSNVQYTGKATDLDKAQTSYTTKTITTVFRSATSPTNKPASPGNHNDNNNLVTNRREGGEGAEKDQRVWFSPTPTTHTIEREEDLDPQEKKRQLQEQYNILQQLQRENMQEASAEPEQLPEQASPASPTSTSSSDSVASQVQQTRVAVGNGRLPPGAARMEQNRGGDDRRGAAAVKTVTETIKTVTTDGQVKSETIIY